MRTAIKVKTINCKHCNSEFVSTFRRQYCSDQCHRRHWLDKCNESKRAKTAATVITRNCKRCGAQFSFQLSLGKNNLLHCSHKCSRAAANAAFKLRRADRGTCTVEGCCNPVDRVLVQMCEMHYGRVRTKGRTGKAERRGRYTTREGYVFVRTSEHPLRLASGVVAEHRMVAYDKHHGICPGRHWCGAGLEWPESVADHLNEIKDDNRPDNVVVSCNDCNRARGAMLPFLSAMQPSAHALFLTLVSQRLGMHHDQRTARGE